jgi:hypothetical protein
MVLQCFSGNVCTRILRTFLSLSRFLYSRRCSPFPKSRGQFCLASFLIWYERFLVSVVFLNRQFSGATRRGEVSCNVNTASKPAASQDDFSHRTPHFGYTSEIKERSGVVPVHAVKSKVKHGDSLPKFDGHNSHQMESHGRVSRERDTSISRNRHEVVS